MKTASKRTILTVILAIAFVFATVFGTVFMLMQKSSVADAANDTSKIKIETESVIKRGQTFEVKLVISTDRTLDYSAENQNGLYWSAMQIEFGPVKDGEFDTSIARHMSIVTYENDDGDEVADVDVGNFTYLTNDRYYDFSTVDALQNPRVTDQVGLDGGVQCVFASKHASGSNAARSRYTENPITLTYKVTTDDTIVADGEELDITFGVKMTPNNLVSFGNVTQSVQTLSTAVNGLLTIESASFKLVTATTETDLTAVNAGHEWSDDVDLTECAFPTEAPAEGEYKTAEYNCEHFAMFPLVLEPVIADNTKGATIKFGFDATKVATEGVEYDYDVGYVTLNKPEAEEGETVDVSKVYIYVQSEDYDASSSTGKTQIYVLTLSSNYLGLEDLEFTDYKTVTDATYVGLFTKPSDNAFRYTDTDKGEETEFDPEVLEYRYYLLNDSLKTDGDTDLTLTIKATVPDDDSINTQVAVAEDAENATLTIPDGAGESGVAFDLTAPTDSATYMLTLTVSKADDSSVTKTYKVQIVVVNCDLTFTMQVKGNSGSVYNSSATKALQNDVDLYFALNKENASDNDNKPAKNFVFVKNNAASEVHVVVSDSNPDGYQMSAMYATGKVDEEVLVALGTYTVKAIAEAGNTKDYAVMIAMPDSLTLTLESKYQFLYEKVDAETEVATRTAYAQDNMIHGKDDKEGGNWKFEQIVLGQIPSGTSLVTFMSNIEEDQHDILRIYNPHESNDRFLVYDGMNGGYTSYYQDLASSDLLSIGTGWYVVLGADANNPIDTVYISILGDIDGNGVINANDKTVLNAQVTATADFETTAQRLAGSLTTNCSVSSNDSSALAAIIMYLQTEEFYYTYKVEDAGSSDPTPAE